MTKQEFKEQFARELLSLLETVQRKNEDYSGGSESPFDNFALITSLSQGRISAKAGILTRMSDKVARIGNLLFRPARVTDESLADSCRDLAAYSLIFLIYLQQESDPTLIQAFFNRLKQLFTSLIHRTL